MGCVLCALASPCVAQPDDARVRAELSGWAGSANVRRVHRLADEYGLVAVPSEQWRGFELEAIEAGASSMPRAFFEALDEPVFVERRPEKCTFGQGRYDDRCPSFDADRRTFYLYDLEKTSPELLDRVMAGLSSAERRRLVYRRATVHLIVALLDHKLGWSQQRRWRQINGWDDGEPLNQDWWGYSRPIGRRSAHLDLVTFAEEYFARPESVLRNSTEPGADERREAFEPDSSVECRMMTRSRILRGFVAELAPSWRPPDRLPSAEASPAPSPANTGCPAFEEWLDRSNLEGVELVFVGAKTDQPESLYGHLILRARYGPGADIFREGYQPVFQFGAVTGSEVGSGEYVLKGLFGGFKSVLEFHTWRTADRLFARYEGRDLRRYPLNLTRAQTVRLMQRIREAQRHFRFPYYFFKRNCASFIVDLLRPALDEPVADLPSLIVMPTDVLDALAKTPNGGRGPLLDQDYLRWPSSEARALDAVVQRRRLLAELLSVGDGARQDLVEVAGLHDELEQIDPDGRRRAYEKLADAVSTLGSEKEGRSGAEDESFRENLVDYAYLSTVIERYFIERARFDRRESVLQTGEAAGGESASRQLERLRDISHIRSVRERLQAWNEYMNTRIQHLAPVTDQPATASAKQRWDLENRVGSTYQASLEALGGAISAVGDHWNGTRYADQRREASARRQRRFNRRAIGPSGNWMAGQSIKISPERDGNDAGPVRPGLELSVAYIRDELGEARLRGYRPDIESKALDLTVGVEPGARWPETLYGELIVFRYMNINRKHGPFVSKWADRFGWGVDAQTRHDSRRGLKVGGDLSAGYLYPLWTSARGINHLVLAAFGDVRADVGESASRAMIGLRGFARAQVHLYGSFANLLQLELQTHQLLADDNTHQWDVSAQLNTRHALGDVSSSPIWIEPFVEVERTSRVYLPDADLVDDVGFGLRLEVSL